MSTKRLVRAQLSLQDGTKITINCPHGNLANVIAGLRGASAPTPGDSALAKRIISRDPTAILELGAQCSPTPGIDIPGASIHRPRSSDPAIANIQNSLKVMGLRSTNAVSDGVIDPGASTERSLSRLGLKVERAADGAIANKVELAEGVADAKRIHDMQKALNAGCGTRLATDGDFGAQTREAALKVVGMAEEAARKKADSPAKTAELEALTKARTDLVGNDKKVDAATLETVQKAVGEHGDACKAANKAIAIARPAAAPKRQPEAEQSEAVRPAVGQKAQPESRRQRQVQPEFGGESRQVRPARAKSSGAGNRCGNEYGWISPSIANDPRYAGKSCNVLHALSNYASPAGAANVADNMKVPLRNIQDMLAVTDQYSRKRHGLPISKHDREKYVSYEPHLGRNGAFGDGAFVVGEPERVLGHSGRRTADNTMIVGQPTRHKGRNGNYATITVRDHWDMPAQVFPSGDAGTTVGAQAAQAAATTSATASSGRGGSGK